MHLAMSIFKIKFTLLLICLLFSISSFAQNVTAKWGPIQKSPGSRDIEGVIGRDKSGFYVAEVKYSGRIKVFIKKFGNDNTEIYTKEINAETANGGKIQIEDIIMIENQMLLFTSYYDKKDDKNYAFVSRLNAEGNVEGATVQIDEIAARKKKNAGSFHFYRSADSSKILIYHNEPWDKDKDADKKFFIKVMDKNLNVLWSKKCVVPYKDKDFVISDYTLSNDNKVYMLAKIQEGKREKKDGMPNYRYTILGFTADANNVKPDDNDEDDGSDAEEYVISLSEKFISAISFQLDKANNLICAGFYSENNSSEAAGIFFLKIDSKSKSVLLKNVKPFSKDVLRMFMSDRKINRGNELYGYQLRNLIPKKSGGSYLVAEQYEFYISSYTDSRGITHSTAHYIYNDIVVVNLVESGEIAWVCRIPKFQQTINDGGYYSSFASLVLEKDEKLCFIYNDNQKNLNEKDFNKIRPMGNLKKTIVNIVIVDNQGNYEKAALLNNKEDKVVIRPKMYLQSSANELILYGRRGKKYRFGNIKVE